MKNIFKKETYELTLEIARIGSQALHKAHKENHNHNLPNIFTRNDKLYFEMPDGTITTDNPFK
jgi:hypothetical protein